MDDCRLFRSAGELLVLGGTEYRIEAVEGAGGSCVVYLAVYEDFLNKGTFHHVLIKELFPLSSKGDIFRGADGAVCCMGKGAELMGQYKNGFLRGNRANLMLLEKSPATVSGNINSYEAYGTFYSVLPAHGGTNLKFAIESGGQIKTIKDSAHIIMNVLDAVECFHKNGTLHLDISPDNILLLPKQALLIDYNSVWLMDGQTDAGGYFFSEKDGYTAPEVRLREIKNICPATDIYSVCALWFHMLVKRRLDEEEIIKNKIAEPLSEALGRFDGEYATVTCKAVQIIKKGLHVLPRKRYQSVQELRDDVEELLLRIDQKGISQAALWEGSLRDYRAIRHDEGLRLNRSVRTGNGEIFSAKSCETWLNDGAKLLLRGAGGMGKTSLLTDLWKDSIGQYDPQAPAAVYVPLMDYQAAGGESCFIQKYLLRHICLQEDGGMKEALHELNRQLDAAGGLKLVLLLDGLNEAGSACRPLLTEIEALGRKPSLGILIADRSDSVKEYGLGSFHTIELLSLSEEAVRQELAGDGLNFPSEKGLQTLLGNPMLLTLYRETMKTAAESENESGFEDQGEGMDTDKLVGLYLESLLARLRRTDAGNQAEQLRHAYILQHFLPCIAGSMKRRKRTILTVKELCALAEADYCHLQEKVFGLAFPEYLGKSRLILEGIKSGMEWFDYAAGEQLSGRLDLIRRSGDGNYCLVHENFAGYLSGLAEKNRRRINAYKRKAGGKKALAAAGLMATLAGAGAGLWNVQGFGNLSESEQYKLKEVLYQTSKNLGTLGMQIDIQQQILDSALQKEVLEGDKAALERFLETYDYRLGQVSGYNFERSKNEKLFDELEGMGTDIPTAVLKELFTKTFEMDMIMEDGMAHLEEGILREVLSYSEKETLALSYKNYLDAYADVTYREINVVLSQLDSDMTGELLEIIGQTAVFRNYIRVYSFEGKSEETLKVELDTAKAYLTECMNKMKTLGYDIHIMDWR